MMVQEAGGPQSGAFRLDFDRHLKREFHGSSVTSDAGLLAYRELADALGLIAIAGQHLVDGRTGKNGRHDLVGMLRQSVFGRLAGYEDVNDAARLGHDPAMRWIVGGYAVVRDAASTSQMGQFETEWLANDENLAALKYQAHGVGRRRRRSGLHDRRRQLEWLRFRAQGDAPAKIAELAKASSWERGNVVEKSG
jgi:Transposase DDE domain group 1